MEWHPSARPKRIGPLARPRATVGKLTVLAHERNGQGSTLVLRTGHVGLMGMAGGGVRAFRCTQTQAGRPLWHGPVWERAPLWPSTETARVLAGSARKGGGTRQNTETLPMPAPPSRGRHDRAGGGEGVESNATSAGSCPQPATTGGGRLGSGQPQQQKNATATATNKKHAARRCVVCTAGRRPVAWVPQPPAAGGPTWRLAITGPRPLDALRPGSIPGINRGGEGASGPLKAFWR